MKPGNQFRLIRCCALLSILFVLSVLMSCKNAASPSAKSGHSDTTKAIELAIHTVLTEDFPEAPAMKKIGPYNDSLYFASGNFSNRLLPNKVDSFNLHILPDSILCKSMKRDTSVHAFPNYIRLADFENRDSGYFIKLESLNCMAGNEGGSVGVFIVKSKDNFVFKK